MTKNILLVDSVTKLNKDIYKMVLKGDFTSVKAPGQFINIKIDGFYLRRPISIYDYNDEYLTIIFKVVGEGTRVMSEMKKGQELDVLFPLGNGFDTSKSNDEPYLIGGGIGTPPLYALCKKLIKEGKKPHVILGFTCENDVILIEEFKALGCTPFITTNDGSVGTKGFVTAVMNDVDYCFTCGPEPMLKAVYNNVKDGQFSFEARMACGFGVCMGCSCKTKYGNKRICKDGPVLEREEIIW